MTGGLTWQEATARLGVDKRTLQRLVRAGTIGCEARPGFPTLYDPVDVEIAAQARPRATRTGVLAASPTPNGNGHGAIAHHRDAPTPIEALLFDVLQGVRAALAAGVTGATPGVTGATPGATQDPWMTPYAVARAWTWPRRVVLKLMEEGKLGDVFYIGTPARPRAVVRRSAVEAFAAGRKDSEAL